MGELTSLTASKSRSAQENLAELEKNSAPFEDQLREAAKFVGLDLDDIGRSFAGKGVFSEVSGASIYHGREEWLLRWLLKRLQDPKDAAPRKFPNSWLLFCHLIRTIPPPNVARMLNERKFMVILRQTLEEAMVVTSNEAAKDKTVADAGTEEIKTLKKSKKRKRSGELISTSKDLRSHIQGLPAALFEAMHQMLSHTQINSERDNAFSKECMRAVIRTPAEDAAKILGAWLSLCPTSLGEREFLETAQASWLSPFVDIWKCRIVGSDDLTHFSLHCTQPLLSLIKMIKTGAVTPDSWMSELGQLAARNIIIPAKAAKFENDDSDLLNTLTRISVIQDSTNAPILFEVAILSIQVQGSRRRRPNDESWLHTVFTTLIDAMPPKRAKENGEAIRQMVQSAIKYKVTLDLPTLRSIASQYCFSENDTNWELLATIIKLDANVFLIPDKEKDLVQQVLTRVTAEWLTINWPDICAQVVSEVVIPLMNGFAQARDLSTFIRHWHGQIIESSKLRDGAPSHPMILLFSAWEYDSLQTELSRIMEASLTINQITQVLDWLASQVTEHPDATCLILEAMAGSIDREEVVDAVGLRPFHIMFDNGVSEKLSETYKWRSWRILSRTLKWITQPGLEELSILWEERHVPFNVLSSVLDDGSIATPNRSNNMKLETLRFVCAARNVSRKGMRLDILTRKPAMLLLRSLSQDLKEFLQELTSAKELSEQTCGSAINTSYRGFGWTLWSSVSCMLVEFPKVLHRLGVGVEGNTFRDLLQTIFWISSAPRNEPPTGLNSWLRDNPDAFSSVWTSLLNNDEVLSNTPLAVLLIDIMLSNATSDTNPLVNLSTTNAFAVQCLLQLPIEVFSKRDRERVMKVRRSSFEAAGDGNFKEWVALDDAVLSLRIKMMQRSTIYDGTRYQDLVVLADDLASANIESPNVSLLCFKELARRTLSHITANLDQSRNREYVLNALDHLRKKMRTRTGDKIAHKLNFGLVALFEVLFEIFTAKAKQLNDLSIITQHDLSTLEETFQICLLSQLKHTLSKFKKTTKPGKQAERSIMLRSVIEALIKSSVDREKVASAVTEAKHFVTSLKNIDVELSRRLETLIAIYTPSADSPADSPLERDISAVDSRRELLEKTSEFIKSKSQSQKLALLQSALEEKQGWTQLDKLLISRQMIISCEESRQLSDEYDELSPNLSSIYSLLCSHLLRTTSFRHFSLISETMALTLRTKCRAINQWNVDSTLGHITMMCSRNSPCLRPSRAGSIYIHLCQLLQTLLTSHRLKLEGHFHLVVQAMQSLLRCLFTPLPHSTSETSKIFAPPSWLSSPKYQLGAKHAAAFTRLVTLICDPSVSSVTRSKQNNLTSATDRAKRMAGQHMHFVLNLYVQLQLEMRMRTEVREKMVPGLYAIFDTTTPEMRRMISDGLDSSGRAVFGILFKDYQKFGKWKGS
ncbi:Unhealthy ribosome biogenesis 2 [Hyphodiscus hymeniophilus]|uniref:Unhealthy ribosome biogenesis 2 n=1 Tax=Hyphodiscus hymeniophilus TaxID=353542 RepID=A0A9P6SQ43_9HELO|nr:Unhealthy ribosome biogenesis 2 [Hyphodiscus hymeniophilus]